MEEEELTKRQKIIVECVAICIFVVMVWIGFGVHDDIDRCDKLTGVYIVGYSPGKGTCVDPQGIYFER